jgi:hypothetical protein
MPVTRSMTVEEVEVAFENRLQFCNLVDTEEEWASLMLWCKWKGGGRHPVMGFDGRNDWCWNQIPETIRDLLMPVVKAEKIRIGSRQIT